MVYNVSTLFYFHQRHRATVFFSGKRDGMTIEPRENDRSGWRADVEETPEVPHCIVWKSEKKSGVPTKELKGC